MTELQKRKNAIEELERRKSALVSTLAETSAKLAELEARIGDDYLDGNADDAIRRLSERRLKFDAINSAVNALARRRAAAEIDLQRAQVADVRMQAEAKRTEIAALRVKAKHALDMLSNIEDVQFTAHILNSQVISDEEIPDHLKPSEIQGSFRGNYARPRSRRLFDEAAELDVKADSLEREISRIEGLQQAAAA
jgi:hypothetical protein